VIKKLSFQFEIFFRFLKKNILFLGIGVLLGSSSIKIYPYIYKLIKSQKTERQKIGISGLYTLDNLPAEIKQLVSFGLTTFTSNNRPEKSILVQGWKTENDNKDFIFTINTDIKWHDGQKIKPSDINYQIKGAQLEPLGKDQLKISLNTPYSPILSLLSDPIIKKGTIGLGPYKINKITFQKDFIKTVNLIALDQKDINKTYVFYDQENKLIEAYKLGEIDIIEDISSPQDLNIWPKTKITPKSQIDQSYIAIFINTQKFSQKEVRQALAYATPKTPNKEERAISPISPLSWAYNDSIKTYNLSPQKAQSLIKDTNMSTNVSLAVNNRKLLPLADQIKESWQTILGIEVNVSIENQINPDNYDCILAYAAIPKDPDQYEFWHSTQSTNITRINSPKIDKLLEEGRQIFDIQKRKEIYIEFQKILLEESPVIFLSYPTTFTIERLK
jgi:ABC-type transport system substrate-binding protein